MTRGPVTLIACGGVAVLCRDVAGSVVCFVRVRRVSNNLVCRDIPGRIAAAARCVTGSYINFPVIIAQPRYQAVYGSSNEKIVRVIVRGAGGVPRKPVLVLIFPSFRRKAAYLRKRCLRSYYRWWLGRKCIVVLFMVVVEACLFVWTAAFFSLRSWEHLPKSNAKSILVSTREVGIADVSNDGNDRRIVKNFLHFFRSFGNVSPVAINYRNRRRYRPPYFRCTWKGKASGKIFALEIYRNLLIVNFKDLIISNQDRLKTDSDVIGGGFSIVLDGIDDFKIGVILEKLFWLWEPRIKGDICFLSINFRRCLHDRRGGHCLGEGVGLLGFQKFALRNLCADTRVVCRLLSGDRGVVHLRQLAFSNVSVNDESNECENFNGKSCPLARLIWASIGALSVGYDWRGVRKGGTWRRFWWGICYTVFGCGSLVWGFNGISSLDICQYENTLSQADS